ncbi:MAG: TOMM precursor leader peptide-binding protein [Clostridia bacterium]|nr:TOMM precursor leader peptide-binding protein [Clostridia bacterium]
MSDNIIINPRFTYGFVEDAIILYSERKNIILSNPKICHILSRISEGVSNDNDLIDALESSISAAEVIFFLRELEKSNIITRNCCEYTKEEAAFWGELEMSPAKLHSILNENTVSIRAINYGGSIEEFYSSFEKNKIRVSSSGMLDIIVTDDYESPELSEINKDALKAGKRWMLVKPSGTIIWIGPVFEPAKTGCWKCLEQRVSLNKSIHTFVRGIRGESTYSQALPSAASGLRIAADITSLEVAKLLYFNESKNLEGKLLSFDTDNLSMNTHTLVKRPQCAECGDPKTIHQIQNKAVLLDREDNCNLSYDGGFRTSTPESTIEKYRHHVSPITGVVQTLEQIPDQKDSPVYNYYSGANTALKSKSLYWLNNHIRSFSGGKGKNHSQAKAGALCEAIERYSCSFQGEEEVINATYEELGGRAIHPYNCLNFSKKQYQMRAQLNAECSKYYFMIPGEFDEKESIDWTRVLLLGSEDYKYLPANYCYYQYPVKDELKRFCYPDSNGNAAGNTIEEAILQGLLELIERDSVAIWWYNMLNCPEVDIKSFDDSYFNQLIEYYKTMGRSLYVLDLNFDLNIPCFAAVSCDKEGKKPLIGFGAHTDARIALERALIELNQFLPILYDGRYSKDPAISSWLDMATIDNQPYLIPLSGIKKSSSDYGVVCKPSIIESIKYCQHRLKDEGMDVYFLNITKPDIGLPVAKVIVPGLRHFWKRLGPGRLYEVPVKMKILKQKKEEEELNPISVFF